MKTLFWTGWLVISSVIAPVMAPPRHLQLAQQLVNHISAGNTNYQHGQSMVSWKSDTSDYQCHTDCSGFLNALLQQSYGVDRPYFKRWLGANRPYAYHYFDAIQNGKGFQLIQQVTDLQPGDIIAIKYVDRSEHDSNTGHCRETASPARQAAHTR